MKVLDIKEVPDEGVYRMEVELTEEEHTFFLEYAINDIVTKGMEAHEEIFKKDKDES